HGAGLVRQLLAYGRKEHLSPRPIRLTDEFSHFVSILRRALNESIEISFAGSGASWAEVDRTAFEQMILNLGTNARDAMPAGGRLTVRTGDRVVTESEAAISGGERTPGRYTTISVTDTGRGMPPEIVRRVTEPFFTTKPIGKGTGLGMSMVYGLMKQHHGWVDIESAVGTGTTVTLGFPIVPAPATAPTLAPTVPMEGCPGRGELLLVVEDEASLRRVATRTLEREGFKVLTAPDGEAGWTQWQEHGDDIALIITDAVMPKLGGAELIRRLRSSGATVPVVLMSGYSADDLTDPLLKDVPIIAKPWSGEALGRRIREVLDAGVDGRGR
ncbi:MAG: response regulator, partial [Gemmatimonadetes bacterium]|nr:response regulator [Gemmatimonadota bacterium]